MSFMQVFVLSRVPCSVLKGGGGGVTDYYKIIYKNDAV